MLLYTPSSDSMILPARVKSDGLTYPLEVDLVLLQELVLLLVLDDLLVQFALQKCNP